MSAQWKEDKSLGEWVSTQRNTNTIGKLSPAREALLDDIGFSGTLADVENQSTLQNVRHFSTKGSNEKQNGRTVIRNSYGTKTNMGIAT